MLTTVQALVITDPSVVAEVIQKNIPKSYAIAGYDCLREVSFHSSIAILLRVIGCPIGAVTE